MLFAVVVYLPGETRLLVLVLAMATAAGIELDRITLLIMWATQIRVATGNT